MPQLLIDLNISSDEYLKNYQLPGAVVVGRSRDGRSVRFPANILRPYVSRSGVIGSFIITFDQAGKFTGLMKV